MDYENDDDEQLDPHGVGDINNDGSYVCQSCGEEIVIPLDITQGEHQQYVEDCPICCHPNRIDVRFEVDGNASIVSEPE